MAFPAGQAEVTPIGALLYLPLAPRGLWEAVTAAMRRDRTTVLRINGAPVSDEQLARRLCISVEELREARQPLLDTGLLRLEADGAIAAPLLEQRAELRRLAAERRAQFERDKARGVIAPEVTPRQHASRTNGFGGGRPPIHAPGQRNLLPPQVVGGTASQVRDYNPSTVPGSRDQVLDLVPDRRRSRTGR